MSLPTARFTKGGF